MPRFTIETTYRIPIYRQRAYEADTIEQACRLATEDDDWSEQKEDYDCSGDTYVTGVWPGGGGSVQRHCARRSVTVRRGRTKADHFKTPRGVLKALVQAPEGKLSDSPLWRQSADAAIAKAEAILAGAHDPVIEGGAP
jgi:hypothetical protein